LLLYLSRFVLRKKIFPGTVTSFPELFPALESRNNLLRKAFVNLRPKSENTTFQEANFALERTSARLITNFGNFVFGFFVILVALIFFTLNFCFSCLSLLSKKVNKLCNIQGVSTRYVTL
jgi:hypothetical protein